MKLRLKLRRNASLLANDKKSTRQRNCLSSAVLPLVNYLKLLLLYHVVGKKQLFLEYLITYLRPVCKSLLIPFDLRNMRVDVIGIHPHYLAQRLLAGHIMHAGPIPVFRL